MEAETIFSVIILIFSVVIHEVAHGYAALFLGDRTADMAGRLTLNPIKHLTLVGSFIVPLITSFAGFGFGWAKPVPFNPDNLNNKRWGEALVAVAGPISNLLLAILFAFLWGFMADPVPNSLKNTLFLIVIAVNCSLAVLNLIPIPPLDGSKILFSLIPRSFYAIRDWMEQYQIILLILVIFFWQFFEPLVRGLIEIIIRIFVI